MKLPLFKKIIFIGIFILCFAIFLEIFLRLTGIIYLKLADQKFNSQLKEKDTLQILCIGESTTFLGGENSYPSQLEAILNTQSPNRKFKVINKGLPGVGSSQILSQVPEWIKVYQPDILVTMMGINDHNNLIPFGMNQSGKKAIFDIKNFRIYKLTLWLTDNIHQITQNYNKKKLLKTLTSTEETMKKPPEPDVFTKKFVKTSAEYQKLYLYALASESKGYLKEAEQILNHLINMNDDETLTVRMYEKLAGLYLQQNKYSNLLAPIKSKLYNPYDSKLAEWINLLCKNKKDIDKLMDLLNSEISKRPNHPGLYHLMSGCYQELGDIEKQKQAEDLANKIRIQNFNPTTKENYQRLDELITKSHLIPVFVQYPIRDIESLKIILEDLPGFEKYFFVDNQDLFKNLIQEHGYDLIFIDRFAGDFGHCSPLGNKFLAANVADTILDIINSEH